MLPCTPRSPFKRLLASGLLMSALLTVPAMAQQAAPGPTNQALLEQLQSVVSKGYAQLVKDDILPKGAEASKDTEAQLNVLMTQLRIINNRWLLEQNRGLQQARQCTLDAQQQGNNLAVTAENMRLRDEKIQQLEAELAMVKAAKTPEKPAEGQKE